MEARPFNHTGYNQWLQEGKLMGSRCQNCGAVYLPPRALCTRCYTSQMEWLASSGEGSLTAFTRIHVGLPVMAAQGYNRERPYCSGVVQLAEGPSISARILTDQSTESPDLRVGLPVQAVFIKGIHENVLQTVLAFQAKVMGA